MLGSMRTLLIVFCLMLVACSSSPTVRAERDAVSESVRDPRTAGGESGFAWQTIGTSMRGAPIQAAEFGSGPTRVLIVGGIHGDEDEAIEAVEALRRHLVVFPPPARVLLVRDVNPDGSAAGTRGNSRGVDLNRNWPARSFRADGVHGPAPLSEVESRVLHAQIEQFAPNVMIVLHSARGGPFVNFDGPAGGLAERFAEAARATDARWRVQAEMGYATPGSLGSYIGIDRGLPILTIEFARGHEASLAKLALIDGVTATLEHAATSGR